MYIKRGIGYVLVLFAVGTFLAGCTGNPPSNPPPSTDPYNNPPSNTDPYNNPPSTTDPYNNPPSSTDPYNNPPPNYRKIDINTAGHAELESLPGIGPVLADEIINYRFFYGPFRTPHDIVKVRGIGEEKYYAISNLITASGASAGSYYHPPSSPTDPYAGGSSTKLNINIATQAELESLPGIGPAKARAIIDYRNRYGKFQRKEDVKLVPGIGDSIYYQIESYIVAKGGGITNSELDLAYKNYMMAYQRFTSLQNDPYATYTDQRRAYDQYLAAKKEYDRLSSKYGN